MTSSRRQFLGGGDELAVADQRSGGIAVEGVETEYQHERTRIRWRISGFDNSGIRQAPLRTSVPRIDDDRHHICNLRVIHVIVIGCYERGIEGAIVQTVLP